MIGVLRLAVDFRHFAGMNAGENDRRLAGIRRRRDPGIDAEVCRQHDALPVESRRHALPALAAGGNEGGDDGNEHEAAHRIRIAHRQPRRRPSGLEGTRGGKRSRHMGLPQRERIGIGRRDGEFIGDRRRRTMQNAAAAIEPAQRLGGGRHAQEGEWDHGGDSERREYEEAGRARQRRQEQPQAQPGDSEEQADDDSEPRQCRPQPFPEDAPARAAQSERRVASARLHLPSGTKWNDGSARVPSISSPRKTSPEQDDCPSNRHPAPASCLSMIFSENRSSTFRDHARDNAATKGQFKGGGSTGPRRKGSRAMQNS